MSGEAHTPPLGYAALTPFYDRAIAALTREAVWRARLVHHLNPQRSEAILDVGCGTGSLAIATTAVQPECNFRGIDPDRSAVTIARRKAALAGSGATFEIGRLDERPVDGESFDKIVCSLVLHQVPLAEKRRMLGAMHDWLKPGGHVFIADYGRQPTLATRLAFRLTVQMLDGKADTQPNADGVLPALVDEAGFGVPTILDTVNTITGRIEIIGARKSPA